MFALRMYQNGDSEEFQKKKDEREWDPKIGVVDGTTKRFGYTWDWGPGQVDEVREEE